MEELGEGRACLAMGLGQFSAWYSGEEQRLGLRGRVCAGLSFECMGQHGGSREGLRAVGLGCSSPASSLG